MSSAVDSPTRARRIERSATETASSTTDQSSASRAANRSGCDTPALVAITDHALAESLGATLQDLFDLLLAVIDGANLFKHGTTTVGREHEHAFRLAKNRNVWIMCDEDYLSTALHRPKGRDDCVVDKRVIKIVFRLID